MQLIRGLHNLPKHAPCALTIGNFDGVHRGHQALLQRLVISARDLGLPSCLLSFEPLPQEFFARHKAPPRLTRLREKWNALCPCHIDEFLCMHFDKQLAGLSATDFIHFILLEKLNTRYLLVGDDFRFGKDRLGDYNMLKQAGKKLGFTVEDSPSICQGDTRISSTAIRAALSNNQLALAQSMLGRPYQICGRVAHGDKRGRTIGFPTINIKLRRHATPLSGVYAVSLQGIAPTPLKGVANIGKRPTVDGTNLQLEVHLFNFDQSVYGHEVCVEFHHKLREEQRFESFDALKQQIRIDSDQARHFFAAQPKTS